MIHYCTALGNDESGDMLRANARKGRPLVEGFGYVAWIGVEPTESPLRRFPQERQLLVRFNDVTAPQDGPAARWHADSSKVDLFTTDHAAEIRAYCNALHADTRPWALLVHCTAGISRSPAIALWVRERYGVTLPENTRRQYGWLPNATVARILRET
jgi:predicted protein tyrosine phosphatase